MKTLLIPSKHLLLLYDLAEIEAAWHVEALSKYITVDDFTKDRLLKLHLLNILGWRADMVDKIEIIDRWNVKKDGDEMKEKEIAEIRSMYDFYQEINPLEYYDFLLQKIGDPYRLSIVWSKVI
jgi:hypothetical protein